MRLTSPNAAKSVSLAIIKAVSRIILIHRDDRRGRAEATVPVPRQNHEVQPQRHYELVPLPFDRDCQPDRLVCKISGENVHFAIN